MPPPLRSSGPCPAPIAVIGEAPGREEEASGTPFIGASGRLLTDALHGAGISRSSCFISNVCRVRPPDNDISLWLSENKKPPSPLWEQRDGLWIHPHVSDGLKQLEDELAKCQPKLIVALGNTPLWALTGNRGILKWRGSRLWSDRFQCHVLPTIHPAAVLRQLSQQVMLHVDLKRAVAIYEGRQVPLDYNFAVAPSYEMALYRIGELYRMADRGKCAISCDIETRRGYMACLGYAWTTTDAICIPFLKDSSFNPFYWSKEQEAELRYHAACLFQHPNITWIGQNFLYDCQYFHREGMGYPPNVFDTMIGHHSLFSNMRKGLDFLSSFYAHDHVYWKDESKNWDPALGEKQLWTYNCKDSCIAYECYDGIHSQARQLYLR